MKGNEDECHVLISTDETVQVNIAVTNINNSKCEKLLGFKIMIAIDMENICKRAGAKLNAFIRVVQNMNTKKLLNYESFFFVTI